MSILSQLKDGKDGEDEKIISGFPINDNVYSIDDYNKTEIVNILGDDDYNISFKLKDNKCLCINEDNKLRINSCNANTNSSDIKDRCKFKVKSENPDNNYNDKNESIKGKDGKGISINLTYNNEYSDRYGNTILDLTQYNSSNYNIIMKISAPGIKCYYNNKLLTTISENVATLNDIYRNNSTCTHIDLYCHMFIEKDDGDYYLKHNNNNILFEKTPPPTKWILRFINTPSRSRFNKCHIIDYSTNKYLLKTSNNTLQLTNIEKNATLFNFRVKKDIDNYKFLFINDKTDPNNNLISLRSYNNVNEDTNKLYNLKFKLNVEKNGNYEKKQINIDDTILMDENNNLTISNLDLLDVDKLSKKIDDVEYDITTKYNNNYSFLIDYPTFRNNLDELKTVARYYRNLIRNIYTIENYLKEGLFINEPEKNIDRLFTSKEYFTKIHNTCIQLEQNYDFFLLKTDDTSKNNNTFLECLNNAIIDEDKINFLIGKDNFNTTGLLDFLVFFKDKNSMYYRDLLNVYLLNFKIKDVNNLPNYFKNNKRHQDLQLLIDNDNKKYLERNKINLDNFNIFFEKFTTYQTNNFGFLNDDYDYYITTVRFINNSFRNKVTIHSYNNITNLYDNFDSIKIKIDKINEIKFSYSITEEGINNLNDFYTSVYTELDKFGIQFITSVLNTSNDAADATLYIRMNEIFNSKGEPTLEQDNLARFDYFIKLYRDITKYFKNNIINKKRNDLIKNLSFENYTNINSPSSFELEDGIFRIYYLKIFNDFIYDIYVKNRLAISYINASMTSETIAFPTTLGPTTVFESFKNREGFEPPTPRNYLKHKNTLKELLDENKMLFYTVINGVQIQEDNIEDYVSNTFMDTPKLISETTWDGDYSKASTYKCEVDGNNYQFSIDYSYNCLDEQYNDKNVQLKYDEFGLANCTSSSIGGNPTDVCSFNYSCKLIIQSDKVYLKISDNNGNQKGNLIELILLNDYNITENELVNFDDCVTIPDEQSFKNSNVINTNILPDYDQEGKPSNDEINSLYSIDDIIDTSINSITKLEILYDNKNRKYLTTDDNNICLVIRDGKFKLIYVTKKKKQINGNSSRLSGESEHSSQIIDNVNYGDIDTNEFYLYNNPNYTTDDSKLFTNNISKFGYVDIKGQFHKLEDGSIDKISTSYDISHTTYCLDENYVNPGYTNCDYEETCLGKFSIDNGCANGGALTCYMIDDIKNLYISHTGDCVADPDIGNSDSGKFEQKRYSIKRDSSDKNINSHITNSEKTHTITNTKYLELMNNYLSSENFDTSSFLNNISNSVIDKYKSLRDENERILNDLIVSYNELSEKELNIINKSTEMKEDLQKNILENYKKNIDNIDKTNKYINLEEGRENQYRNLKRESDYKLAFMGILSITSVIMLLHYTKK